KDTNALLTTDMLHDETDLPDGIEPGVVGWRAMAVSLSDIAAMGGAATAGVLAFGAPEFEREFIENVVGGAQEACESVGARYVGGDMDRHDEMTLVSTVLGEAGEPVRRRGANAGDKVCVTGELGRTAVALRLFNEGEDERANDLFTFSPRLPEGRKLAEHATAMMDISDGLAVSLHQMYEAGDGVGFEIESDKLPLVEGANADDIFVGEDYELVFTLPRGSVEKAREKVEFTVIGECVEEESVRMDGEKLEKRGYEHA
ncbi:MAG: thiamine-phosphate kinase, partial [Halobacteria archaeon]|nr:thiamine-phosphate kinase [Halobacteria archaeon]